MDGISLTVDRDLMPGDVIFEGDLGGEAVTVRASEPIGVGTAIFIQKFGGNVQMMVAPKPG